MDDTPSLYSPFQAFFDQAIVDLAFVYVDVWSFVHLASGCILGFVLIKWLNPEPALGVGTAIVLIYEVIELGLNGILFVPETPVDLLWDIIIGVGGMLAAIHLRMGRRIRFRQQPKG